MKAPLLTLLLLALAPLAQARENLQAWHQALAEAEQRLAQERDHLRRRQQRVERLLALIEQSPRRSDGKRAFAGQWYPPAQLARQARILRERHRRQARLLQAMARQLDLMGARREALAWRIRNTTRQDP